MITPDWLNYALMDAITDEFANPILQVEMEAVSIDELSMVLKRWEQADMVRRISRCRRRSTQLSRLLTSKMDVLKSLMKRYEDWASEEGFLEGEEQLTEDEKKAFNDVYLYLGDIQGTRLRDFMQMFVMLTLFFFKCRSRCYYGSKYQSLQPSTGPSTYKLLGSSQCRAQSDV